MSTTGGTTKSTASKRERDELYDAGSDDDFIPAVTSSRKKKKSKAAKSKELDATARVFAAELLPYPYFYYRDHSTEMDEDPLTPVTCAGLVPCFPAKMHAGTFVVVRFGIRILSYSKTDYCLR